jgi:hypothetical protein
LVKWPLSRARPVGPEMTKEAGALSGEAQGGIIAKAVDSTPPFIFAFSGGMIVSTVCIVAGLQLSGMASPLQRVVNAKAAGIERAAESIDRSAVALSDLSGRFDSLSNRVDFIEIRLNSVDKYHKVKGVTVTPEK